MKLKNNPIFLIMLVCMMIFGVSYAVDTSGANAPDLYDGALKPVMFDETTGETIRLKVQADGTVTNLDDSALTEEWYNYDEKKWANAVTVDENDNITGYYVWIPRFAYSINSGYHTSVLGVKKVLFLQEATNKDKDDVYHSTLYEDVDYIGDRQLQYLVHPAFSFGGNIKGFWMGKFEASPSESNKNTAEIRILPNKTAWSGISIGDAYSKIASMNTGTEYGLEGKRGDAHLVKNVEWGAMAYLTASKYGKEAEEVWINNVATKVTGMGSAVGPSEAGLDISKYPNKAVNYKTKVNGKIQQSTTGNIYGIYDTSGGLWEYVAGYINTRDQYSNTVDSNTEDVIEANGSSLLAADYKYKDLYNRTIENNGVENFNLSSNKKGDAVWETSSTETSTIGGNVNNYTFSWFGDYSYMPNSYYPFFARGGNFAYGAKSGIFSFMCMAGAPNAITGFRVTIAGV